MAKGRHSNIELHAYGLSHKSGKIQSMGGKKKIKVKTLSEALQANGHSQAEITYLRVSVVCNSHNQHCGQIQKPDT